MKLILKNGNEVKNTLSQNELQVDTLYNKLHIGKNIGQNTINLTGNNIFVQDSIPGVQQKDDVWININVNPASMKYYDGLKWIDLTETIDNIGDLNDLVTINKSHVVDQVNELYSILSTNIIDFKYDIIDSGKKVRLLWKSPVSMEYRKSIIFISDNDISALNYNECVQNQGQTEIYNEYGTGYGTQNYFEYDVYPNRTYYFKIFQKFEDAEHTIYYSQGASTTCSTVDANGPSVCTEIQAFPLSGKVLLKWKDSMDTDWYQTKVFRKEGSAPIYDNQTKLFDGTLITTTTERDKYYNDVYEDESLTNGTLYFYRIVAYDSDGNPNMSEHQIVSTIPNDIAIPEVSSNVCSSINDGQQIQIEWTNPNDTVPGTFISREVYISKNDLTNFNRYKCFDSYVKQDENNISLINLGAGTGQNNNEQITYNIDKILNGDTYSIKIFTRFKINNYFYYSSGITMSCNLIDSKQPSQQMITYYNSYDKEVSLRWTESNDNDLWYTSLCYKIGTEKPDSPTGQDVIEVQKFFSHDVLGIDIRNKYKNIDYIISDLINGTTYTFALFSVDYSGNVNQTGNYVSLKPKEDLTNVPYFDCVVNDEHKQVVKYKNPTIENYPNWQGTVILKNEYDGSSYIPNDPYNLTDCILLTESLVRDGNFQIIDSNVEVGKWYYYRQITFEMNGQDRIYNMRKQIYKLIQI